MREYCYKTLYDNANNELEKINNWLIANRLFLSIKKTKHMIFRTPKSKSPFPDFKLMLRIIPWKKCTTIRFGLIVHEHLSWKPHMDYLSRKLCTSYEVVKQGSLFPNSKILKILYYSMIQSHLSYCICTWCNGNKTALLSLQCTANKFVRVIYYLNYRAPVNDAIKSNEHLTIEQLAT